MNAARNRNPYRGVNWEKRIEVVSCTHMHCTTRADFQAYLDQGLDLAAFANYYPSAPYYPLRSIRENTFRRRQTGYIRNGRWIHETIDFNAEIASRADELSPEARMQLPFREGELLFPDIPSSLLEAPNAEHHYFSDASIWLHITAPGALLASSSFDRDDQFGLAKHGIALGAPVPWREAFRELLDSMLVPDGGGIVIAHPEWSHLPLAFLLEMLDSDPRVLGMEIFNCNDTIAFGGYADYMWNAVLSTGRQCFGFCVQDHLLPDRVWKGRIVLLPEERTAESCLRALRQGRFYGAVTGNGLRFEYLDFDGHVLRAKCNREVDFQLITKAGIHGDYVHGREFRYEAPENGQSRHAFLRLTATEGQQEKLFAQPFMLSG